MKKNRFHNYFLKSNLWSLIVIILLFYGCSQENDKVINAKEVERQTIRNDSLVTKMGRSEHFDFIQWRPVKELPVHRNELPRPGTYEFTKDGDSITNLRLFISPEISLKFERTENEIRYQSVGTKGCWKPRLFVSADKQSIYYYSNCMKGMIEWVKTDPQLVPIRRIVLGIEETRKFYEISLVTHFLKSEPGCIQEEIEVSNKSKVTLEQAKSIEYMVPIFEKLEAKPVLKGDTVKWSAKTTSGHNYPFFARLSCLINILDAQRGWGGTVCAPREKVR